MIARRYNSAKLRYDLVPQQPLKDLVEVYSKGAHKYTLYKNEEGKVVKGSEILWEDSRKYEVVDDGGENWRKGLSWKSTIASAKRHIESFLMGEDNDPELGTRHLANACWNLFSILEYYKTHPELDDRQHYYLNPKRIGLDIDDVLADFCPNFCKFAGIEIPTSWNFGFMEHVTSSEKRIDEYSEFMKTLPVKSKPSDIPFEPVCYITNRHIDPQIAVNWIKDNGFPQVPVIQTNDKVKAALEMKLDIFVDDKFENFVDMNNAGICCFLFDAPHNRRYEVGYKRIFNLKELI